VLLPLSLREPLMRFIHDENAHPGSTRLLASCQIKYWWRGMTTYVNEYASKCQHCKKRNLSHKVSLPPLQKYPGVSRPFQRCHIDLIELPLTPSKYRYTLVVKCALTKWIEMIPLRSKEAGEITEALFEHVFCRHGIIETIVSDNGTEFVNNTMKQFHELLLTKRLTTTPYNPQSNGSVEIFNRTLADMLCAYVNSNQNNWPRYLPIIAHAYRTTVNSATGYSPFRAIYGREARQPSDSWIQDFKQLHDIPIDAYVEELQYILTTVWDDIAHTIQAKEALAERRAEEEANSPHYLPYDGFEFGDSVYIKQIPKTFKVAEDNEKFKLL